MDCRAKIFFYSYPDLTPLFDTPMTGRWSNSPQPQVVSYEVDGKKASMLIGEQNTMNIGTGSSELLDIAIKINGDSNCYGWNNQSYLFGWKNPNWSIGEGQWIVEAVVETSGKPYSQKFILSNSNDFSKFTIDIINHKK